MKTLVIFLMFIAFSPLYAQKENNIWYFGNGAGLDFSSDKPVALVNGNLFTEEGSASVCDEKGNLLFYTNGLNVWERTHNLMANGSGLKGGISSTQSAVIIPVNFSKSDAPTYYIFTVAEKAGKDGLTYSVVDMSAPAKQVVTKNNQILLTPDVTYQTGKGRVTVKNKPLVSPVAEKLTSVPHSNGRDYWVITHQWETNAFYAYPVTAEGIGNPVISQIGSVHKDFGSGNKGESIGCLRASHDGRKIGAVVCYKPNNDIELFNFDNTVGRFSNLVNIPCGGYAYGLCFSPDNSKLYVSFIKGKAAVVQYDIKAANIAASSVVVAEYEREATGRNDGNLSVYGALQIASDKKIYIAKTGHYLDVIHQPDATGKACNYEKNAIYLGPKTCVYGLPELTPRSGTFLSEQKKAPAVVSPPAEKSNDCVKRGPVIGLPRDTIARCVKDIVLNAGNPGAEYLWSTKATSQKITATFTNTFSVTVTQNGCSASAKINVDFREKPTVFNYLPEFSPEKKLFNNSFSFTLNDADNFEMKVFTSGGKLVFQTNDVKKYWDGKDKNGKQMDTGIYKWDVSYMPKCPPRKPVKKEGTVKLK